MRKIMLVILMLVLIGSVNAISFTYLPKQVLIGEINETIETNIFIANPNNYSIDIESIFISEAITYYATLQPSLIELEPNENATINITTEFIEEGNYSNYLNMEVSGNSEKVIFQADLPSIIFEEMNHNPIFIVPEKTTVNIVFDESKIMAMFCIILILMVIILYLLIILLRR